MEHNESHQPKSIDDWLAGYGLTQADVTISAEKIAMNFSRYAKESVVTDNDLPEAPEIKEDMKEWVDNYIQSIEDDIEGIEPKEIDTYFAETIEFTRSLLTNLGTVQLNEFPYERISPSVKTFVARALLKELSHALRKQNKISQVESYMMYSNLDLQQLIESELGF